MSDEAQPVSRLKMGALGDRGVSKGPSYSIKNIFKNFECPLKGLTDMEKKTSCSCYFFRPAVGGH